ncbi:HAD family hydrolase [Micromonosporaceae bacterium Da 78-11]
MTSRRPAAFFDVDETLITVSSIFRFLRFRLADQGRPPAEYADAERSLRSLAAAGVPRDEINRAYFRLYAGAYRDEVADCAERWFGQESSGPGFFHPRVLAALRAHRDAGHLTVLVSGSLPACVELIAEFVGADAALCSRPEFQGGRYTGEVAPMIGVAKASAVTVLAEARDIKLATSFAYGDHISDLPVLSLVGNPTAVGDDPALAAHAAENGWPVWRSHI